MANITIQSEAIPYGDNLPAGDVYLRVVATEAFLSAEGEFIASSDRNALAFPQTWGRKVLCTKDASHVITPEIILPSTGFAQKVEDYALKLHSHSING